MRNCWNGISWIMLNNYWIIDIYFLLDVSGGIFIILFVEYFLG